MFCLSPQKQTVTTSHFQEGPQTENSEPYIKNILNHICHHNTYNVEAILK